MACLSLLNEIQPSHLDVHSGYSNPLKQLLILASIALKNDKLNYVDYHDAPKLKRRLLNRDKPVKCDIPFPSLHRPLTKSFDKVEHFLPVNKPHKTFHFFQI